MKGTEVYIVMNHWMDTCWEQRVRPIHHAIVNCAIYRANALYWRPEFGLPTDDTMERCGTSTYKVYKSALQDLHDWHVIKVLEWSKNQYTSTLISFFALDEKSKAHPKQPQSTDQSTLKAHSYQDKKHIKSTSSIKRHLKTYKDLEDKETRLPEREDLTFPNPSTQEPEGPDCNLSPENDSLISPSGTLGAWGRIRKHQEGVVGHYWTDDESYSCSLKVAKRYVKKARHYISTQKKQLGLPSWQATDDDIEHLYLTMWASDHWHMAQNRSLHTLEKHFDEIVHTTKSKVTDAPHIDYANIIASTC